MLGITTCGRQYFLPGGISRLLERNLPASVVSPCFNKPTTLNVSKSHNRIRLFHRREPEIFLCDSVACKPGGLILVLRRHSEPADDPPHLFLQSQTAIPNYIGTIASSLLLLLSSLLSSLLSILTCSSSRMSSESMSSASSTAKGESTSFA